MTPESERIAPTNHPSFDEFVATIAALRAPDGCPWDRAQTHESIAHNMIEEAYEAVDAIEAHDTAHLREELGDVLLQVVLQSQIAADDGEFTIDDVCAEVNAKMIRRHPHVFGEARADNASEVLDLWDQVKLTERTTAAAEAGNSTPSAATSTSTIPATSTTSAVPHSNSATSTALATPNATVSPVPAPVPLLEGVPTSFPALMQAQKISRKAAAAGFEWDTLEDVWTKVNEEIGELSQAYTAAPKAANGKVDASVAADPTEADLAVAAVEEEFGDVLFSLVNVARRMGVDAESALRFACKKFRHRWANMEYAAQAQGVAVENLIADEREALWEQAKTLERTGSR